MNGISDKIDPSVMTDTLARGLARRYGREYIESAHLITQEFDYLAGFKNKQKKVQNLLKNEGVTGFYIGEKKCLAMIVTYDPEQCRFGGGYIAEYQGVWGFHCSDLKFSLHSAQRLIERLKPSNPRLAIAKAIDNQTRYALTREERWVINLDEIKYHSAGMRSLNLAYPYIDSSDGKLLGMWFAASTSSPDGRVAGKGEVKTFVNAQLLREPQYAQCMEQYEAQLVARQRGTKMPNFNAMVLGQSRT